MSKKCLNHVFVPTVDGAVCKECKLLQHVHRVTNCDFKPRNEFVLLRKCDLGEERGIAIPDIAAQGKQCVVVAMGPDVNKKERPEELKIGDIVMTIGSIGDNYYPLPNDKDLMVFNERNIVLIVGHVDESIKFQERQ